MINLQEKQQLQELKSKAMWRWKQQNQSILQFKENHWKLTTTLSDYWSQFSVPPPHPPFPKQIPTKPLKGIPSEDIYLCVCVCVWTWKHADIPISRLCTTVLFCKYQYYSGAFLLQIWGCTHVGSPFTNEEQKKGCTSHNRQSRHTFATA